MKYLLKLMLSIQILLPSVIWAQQFKFEWARSFGGSKSEIDRVMKVDKKGDLYLFCEVYSSQFSIDNKFFFKWINPENRPGNAVLLKYSPSGELLWGRALKTNGGIAAYGIAIDQENNVVLSGLNLGDHLYLDTLKIYTDANFGYIAFILKLDEEGKLLKYQTFEEIFPGGTFYNQGGIAIDQSGHYYMTAKSRHNIINKNKDTIFRSELSNGLYLLLFKLDQEFNPIWIKKYYNVDGYFGDVLVDGGLTPY